MADMLSVGLHGWWLTAGATYAAVGDVEEGVDRGDGSIGTFAVPAEANVRYDIGYGEDGTEFTGSFGNAPPAAGAFADTFIREFCQWIENNTARVLGTDLLCGHEETDDAQDVDIVLNNGGATDYYSTDMLEKSVQIMSLATTYMQGLSNATELFILCHGKSGITLPVVSSGEELIINTMNCQNSPLYLGKREDGRYEFTFSIAVRIQDAP